MGRRKKQELPFEHWQIIELLHIAQDFYSKPENEAAFQEWKAARDARKAKRPAGAGTPTQRRAHEKAPAGSRGRKGDEEVSVQLVIAAWLIDLVAVWIAKRWLGGEIQGYILFSIMLSYLCAVLTLYEWVVHL